MYNDILSLISPRGAHVNHLEHKWVLNVNLYNVNCNITIIGLTAYIVIFCCKYHVWMKATLTGDGKNYDTCISRILDCPAVDYWKTW